MDEWIMEGTVGLGTTTQDAVNLFGVVIMLLYVDG